MGQPQLMHLPLTSMSCSVVHDEKARNTYRQSQKKNNQTLSLYIQSVRIEQQYIGREKKGKLTRSLWPNRDLFAIFHVIKLPSEVVGAAFPEHSVRIDASSILHNVLPLHNWCRKMLWNVQLLRLFLCRNYYRRRCGLVLFVSDVCIVFVTTSDRCAYTKQNLRTS